MSFDFDEFINYAYEQKNIYKFHPGYFETNLKRVSFYGRVEIDKFFKIEKIEDCLTFLKIRFGFETAKGFNDWRQNSSAEYKKKNDYKDYYSTYSKDYIEKHFSEDIDYFGYEF